MIRKLIWAFSSKKLIFGSECRDIISQTALEISRVAGLTLGPMGRNVMIENNKGLPRITKDGVTVVKHIQKQQDRFKDAICTLIKNSVNSTNKFAGDGTTTSTILIGELLRQSRKYLELGYKPREIKKGLIIGRDLAIDFIKMAAQKIQTIESFYKVAMIATKGDSQLSKIISEAVLRTSSIKIQKSNKTQTYCEYHTGVKMVAGIPHPQFKNVGDKIQMNYPLVLLVRKQINSIEQIINVMQLVKKARKQLFLVCTKMSDSVLSNLIYNKRKNIVEVYPVLLPQYGTIPSAYYQSLRKSTDATLINEFGPQLSNITFQNFGKAIKVQIGSIQTVVYGKAGKQCTNAVIYAGGSTQEIGLEIHDKLVDALNSVQTAKKHGVIAGGGVTYWRAADMLESYSGEFQIGVKILGKALRAPRMKLTQHLSESYRALEGVGWEGYNFNTHKIEDMFSVGVIDSAIVGESVIIDSVSLAHTMMDVETGVVRASRNNESNELVNQIEAGYKI